MSVVDIRTAGSEDEGFSLSVVVPAYNEQEVLREFHRRLSTVLDREAITAEVIYVNDGSNDGTLSVIESLREHDPRVAIVDLSRNYGKEIALSAGLDHALGDAVVVIDADLQDPPELIPEFIREWRNGFDVVYAKRISRDGETAVKKLTAHLFYRLVRRLTRVHIPEDTGDFRLLSRRAVDSLSRLREQHRFMKGLFAWVGFPQKAVEYNRDSRYAGVTKWNYWRLWNFAIEGITSFTIAPLKIATYLGIIVAIYAFTDAGMGYCKDVDFRYLTGISITDGDAIVPWRRAANGNWDSRRIRRSNFDETKRRPLYLVRIRPLRSWTTEHGRHPWGFAQPTTLCSWGQQ